MKIIHLVLGKANPERMNGVNKVVHKLASVQVSMGYDAMVWGISNDLDHNYPERNFLTHLFQQKSNKLTVDPALKKAIGILPEDAIIHFHGAFIPEFFWVSKELRRCHIPYVITPHGAFAPGAMAQSTKRKYWYFKAFEKHILRHARAVQLLGKSGFENTGKLEYNCNRVLIPNGQAISDLPTLPKKENTHIKFGFCGRIDQNHKGLDLLLKGFAIYRQEGGRGTLDLIGDGADRKALIELAEDYNLTKSITFHGARFGQEKFALMNQADVFVHTSRMEGFPMAVLEAAGLGIPCLVSFPTNMAEYIQRANAGLALNRNNPSTIAKALQILEVEHDRGHLKDWGANAKKMIRDNFSWENIAEQLYQVYTTGRLNKQKRPTQNLSVS